MAVNIKDLKIKTKFFILGGIAFITSFIAIFGMMEIAKTTHLQKLERDHIENTVYLEWKTKKYIRSLIKNPDARDVNAAKFFSNESEIPEEKGMEQLVQEIRKGPDGVFEAINFMEEILFKLVGFGEAFEIAVTDSKTCDNAEKLFRQHKTKEISDRQFIKLFSATIDVFKDNSARFAVIVNEASIFVKQLMISISIVSIVAMLGFIFLIARIIIKPLKNATYLAQIIAEGNLTQRINHEQQDEIGILSRAINQICEKMSESIGQVASASQQLAEGSSEQAASIEETSSSLEELSSMTKQNANNANQADNLMKEAGYAVSQSKDSMTKLATSMKDISRANEKTQKIIKTIDEIAFQTNLLALNAAVEAARAGEAGAGFAVVAEEVRSLALRSAEAAKNTATMIEGTVSKTREGSRLTKESGENFAGVVEASSKVGKLISEISSASNEQALGIEQINTAVIEIEKVTQQNAAGAEELASSISMFKISTDFTGKTTMSGNTSSRSGNALAVCNKSDDKKMTGYQSFDKNHDKMIHSGNDDFKDF